MEQHKLCQGETRTRRGLEQGEGGLPRGEVRCEDRPGSSGAISPATPETGGRLFFEFDPDPDFDLERKVKG